MNRYEQLAYSLMEHIDSGAYRPGERIPGTRELAAQFHVSISTVMQAQRLLENRGYVEARPRSGYYVRWRGDQNGQTPASNATPGAPQLVERKEMVMKLVEAAARQDAVQLGAAVPDNTFLPLRALQKVTARVVRQEFGDCAAYSLPPGDLELRRQIAKRMVHAGVVCQPDDVVITSGCHEALLLALQVLTRPGDVVAVESPVYYGLLQLIEAHGLKALEIPCDPGEGMSLGALEMACQQWPVKACILVSNFSNPLGDCFAQHKKDALLELLQRFSVPLIEDDIYGELYFGKERPWAIKARDSREQVIYCSSYSKTIAPGVRIGWLVAPRLRKLLAYEKFTQSLACPTLTQRAVARYLESGDYDRHLRQVRGQYALQVARMRQQIVSSFPPGTRVSQPAGGFMLWVQLPRELDAMRLAALALKEGISISPGPLFSTSEHYQHCLRLNCALQWTPALVQALLKLALLAQQLSSEVAAQAV